MRVTEQFLFRIYTGIIQGLWFSNDLYGAKGADHGLCELELKLVLFSNLSKFLSFAHSTFHGEFANISFPKPQPYQLHGHWGKVFTVNISFLSERQRDVFVLCSKTKKNQPLIIHVNLLFSDTFTLLKGQLPWAHPGCTALSQLQTSCVFLDRSLL